PGGRQPGREPLSSGAQGRQVMNRRSFGLSLALAAMGASSPAVGRGCRFSRRGSRQTEVQLAPEPWGTIKGQFVMADGKVPPLTIFSVNKDKDHCLAEGPIYSE